MRKKFDPILRILVATACLLVLNSMYNVVFGHWPSLNVNGWVILSTLLIVLALAPVAWLSRQRGWKLALTIFILYFGINILNTADEAILFKVGLELQQAIALIGVGLFTSLVFSFILVAIFGKWSGEAARNEEALAPRSIFGWVWRLALADFAYIFCYFAAGLVVFPYVKEYYASTQIPEPGTVLLAQFLRAMVYIAAGVAVASGLKGLRMKAAMVLGFAFPILAGIAPLLLPNEFMPAPIRLAHGIEITVSNCIYGIVLALLVTRRTRKSPVQASHDAVIQPAA